MCGVSEGVWTVLHPAMLRALHVLSRSKLTSLKRLIRITGKSPG